MTVTRNVIEIAASPARIFALAAATERWPQLLPHYRYVHVLNERGTARTVAMGARWGAVPLAWVAEQTSDAAVPHIAFHHIAGPTRGMDVEWRFDAAPHATRVTIEHRLDFRFPIAAAWLERHVVSDLVIHGVAGRTLACIKTLAERAA
ncbi:MAG: SRPBCC family protein [Candidatus Eremiobacteraeota bacterium]|nr:SRPBCC family protein [Candidatus Eremiobacteraeota bacterium]